MNSEFSNIESSSLRAATEFGRARRAEFPLLAASDVVYLDSAASAQKPKAVIDAMTSFQTGSYANVHRGVYDLSQRATNAYEETREKVRSFLGGNSTRETIFTHGTTEALNLVAHSYAKRFLSPGDEIVLTVAEHHSNIVPWQIIAEERGVKLRFAELTTEEDLPLENIVSQFSKKTKLVAVTYLANGLGLKLPVKEIAAAAKKAGAHLLVDGAQAVAHEKIDVSNLGCDFFVFSGHKLYGPTGVGVLWGREALLEQMPPFLAGGDMIRSVTIEKTVYNDLPYKFEAGTPAITEVIGLGAAIDYVTGVGFEQISRHEETLVRYLETSLGSCGGVKTYGPKSRHHGLVTFQLEGVHPHDLSQFLDSKGVAVRAGHHCAQPLMTALGCHATARASLGVYNTAEDIDRLISALKDAQNFF